MFLGSSCFSGCDQVWGKKKFLQWQVFSLLGMCMLACPLAPSQIFMEILKMGLRPHLAFCVVSNSDSNIKL